MRKKFALWRSPSNAVRRWVDRPPAHTEVVLQRNPRVLQVKTPRGNAYLVIADDVAVIDPNLPGEEALIAEALAAEGAQLDDLRHVCCSHLHFDHASALDSIARVTGARLLLPAWMRPFVEGEHPYPFPATLPSAWPFLDVWGRVGFPGVVRRHLRDGGHIGYPWSDFVVQTDVSRYFDDAEAIPELGGLVALHTPGHCPEHVCYLHEETGTLLAGDMYITVRGEVELNRIVMDRDEQAASDRRLRQLGVRTVCPGHGPTMSLG